ncbi:MAG: NAD-dependent epimerase/dehydratase family protein [Tetrasphaera sp.]|jgi:nucleoside-diphosphate-sugar epimerase|nr:NAD-dependent epimerase/dehydratase family protein [Tetrasphaera sp.]
MVERANGPVVIFGASGFIGKHLLDRLQRLGVDVIVPVSETGERIDVAAPVHDLVKAIGNASVVVNAAGRAHLHSTNPADFWAANAVGAGHVAAAAVAARARRLVHVSSVAVGAGGVDPPVSVAMPFTAYGAAKAAGEFATAAEVNGSTIELVMVRPAGIGGMDSPGSWGTIWRRAAAGRRIPVPDNDVRHDVVEIDEVVDFLVRAVTGDVGPGAYALLGPGPTTLAEYADRVAGVLGRTAHLVKVPAWTLAAAGASMSTVQKVTAPARRIEQLTATLNRQRDLALSEMTETTS